MSYYDKYIKYKTKYNKLQKVLKGGYDNLNLAAIFNYKYYSIITKNLLEYAKNDKEAESTNGVLYNLEFIIKKNIFNTLLKINKLPEDPTSYIRDNLYYEYIIGKAINEYKQFLPNFMYTFRYLKNQELLDDSKITNDTLFNFDNNLIPQNIDKYECVNITNSYILIEKIPNNVTLEYILEKYKEDSEFLNYIMFGILYQIYYTLYILRGRFTHNDLHTGNIIFIKLYKYIKIIYPNNVIIYTIYIPIIIDYGRSFIKSFNDERISRNFFSYLCGKPDCRTHKRDPCDLAISGIYQIQNTYNNANDLQYVMDIIRNKKQNLDIIENIMKSIIYSSNSDDENYNFNNTENIYDNTDQKIATCEDLYKWLNKYYEQMHTLPLQSEELYGTLSIYDLTTPFTFIEND
jgi:hypothetical protein